MPAPAPSPTDPTAAAPLVPDRMAPDRRASDPAPSAPALPPLAQQHARLLTLGLDVPPLPADLSGDLLVVSARHTPVADLVPLMRRGDRTGFVVEDLTDLAEFGPVEGVRVPHTDLYAVSAPERGDEYANLSPDEVDPVLRTRGRSPMTAAEGVAWVLQVPEVLERNRCFMTTGSRRAGSRPGRLEARVPALWISNGTGRDGRERRGAPKLGWCWAGNRHTWLGIASVGGRGA
ncbi:DUF5701 family protein [Ornithinimicrobium cerasi]|uniref:Uncharacterized protein n=1 Tax=Ornithinimicrobium cerasi TaxID=2248773 RepID=A0A285VXH9_9MICO|nr:DUF5701 family protein [Ornithinimicrobium cerasi]SOC57966.1 hypothetical protein SAMN05421879_11914 [Ornithinimicrobium cerasi]